MRIGILGDVHGNLEALTTALRALRDAGAEEFLQVGDLVGYGPDPGAVIDLIRELGCTVCLGNHDAAVLGLLDLAYFNNFARQAIQWTRSRLRPRDFDYLRSLQLVVRRQDYTVVHGSLHMPDQFGYVLSPVEARDSLARQESLLCFVGHSHVPAAYAQRRSDAEPLDVFCGPEFDLDLQGYERVLVNVGSVGQPRDEDPRAAYAIYDTAAQQVSIRRADYDIGAVQRKIRASGLSEMLASRLAIGV